MNQSLDKLESSINQLAQKFGAVVDENKRLYAEIARLTREQKQQQDEHQAAVDELSEALLVQVGKLKEDLQGKIDQLMVENQSYRDVLQANAEELRRLIGRLPEEVATKESEA